MYNRCYNFAAGPGVMPTVVLEQARREFLDWNKSGISLLETPFSGVSFKELMRETRNSLRQLLAIPDNYEILFMHGGASAQFSLVPLNLLGKQASADYVETGYWSAKTMLEAGRYCEVRVAASSAATGFDRMPDAWQVDSQAAYCHITSNETANGVQFHYDPETGDVPLVADMTSDFLSRPVEISRYGLIYAGAQKNIGPAGLTLVIVRKDLLGRADIATPSVFNYCLQAEADSMLNTPLTFAIYLAGLVFRWIESQGGLEMMAQNSFRRSARLYQLIDDSDGFYCCRVQSAHRSYMNICFSLASYALTEKFLAEAEVSGLYHLKGHSMTGGIRASLYNAMPDEGVEALMLFMRHFAENHC